MARASRGGMRAPSSAAADGTAAVTALRRRLRLFWRHHEKDFSEWWGGLPQDDKVCMGGRLKRRCCAEALAAEMVSAIFGLCRHARSLPFRPCVRVPSLRCCSAQVNFLKTTIIALPPSRGVMEVEVGGRGRHLYALLLIGTGGCLGLSGATGLVCTSYCTPVGRPTGGKRMYTAAWRCSFPGITSCVFLGPSGVQVDGKVEDVSGVALLLPELNAADLTEQGGARELLRQFAEVGAAVHRNC